jgi:hypothetical protein
MENLSFVLASVTYLADMQEKPVNYVYRPPDGTPVRNTKTTREPRRIYNARALSAAPSLDAQGFVLCRRCTAVVDFYDEAEVRKVYFPEVERLVMEATGAARVVAFDHNVRCAAMAERHENSAQTPIKFAHNDYTLRSGPQRVRDLMGAEAESLLKKRFAVINVWRPIRGPVEESPLAVCDARSMVQQDFVETDLKYRDRAGEVYSIAFNPNHRWFYYPEMRRDEALLLKCYDSAEDGRARFTAHTAFVDPTSSPNSAPRESIEVRTLVFFGSKN